MYRAAVRVLPRAGTQTTFRQTAVRFVSSSTSSGPALKKGTWRSTALRWGATIGLVYWYNTSPLFDYDDPDPTKTMPPPPQFFPDDAPTVEAVIAEKRKQAELKVAARKRAEAERESAKAKNSSDSKPSNGQGEDNPVSTDGGEMENVEQEADQQGAFNPETGEINWDCPCLGGMADGPCGEEFKAAFSCFVYSEEEPKGIDCVDKFQGMQECFRKYPEIYGSELEDEEGESDPEPPVADDEGKPTSIDNKEPVQKDVTSPPDQKLEDKSRHIIPPSESSKDNRSP